MHVLILKMGTTEPSIVAEHGDYDDWFRTVLEDLGCTVTTCAVFNGEPLPEVLTADGILLTGSPLSVRDEAPWMQHAGQWTLRQVQKEIPVLAVCFGHQLLGECLGARVGENSNGPEWGTIEIALQGSDPLFDGLPETLLVQASHRDVLLSLPEGAICLAKNANTAAQAYGWGAYLRAVQFHPEARSNVIADLLAVRGLDGNTEPSDHGQRILGNWVKHWLT